MTTHSFGVAIGDQVYVGSGDEEVYVENAGDFRIEGPAILSAHDGKLVLDPAKLEPKLAKAIANAHARETE